MTPLIPRIESAKVGSISLAYLIRSGSDFRGDRIRCDTGTSVPELEPSATSWFSAKLVLQMGRYSVEIPATHVHTNTHAHTDSNRNLEC